MKTLFKSGFVILLATLPLLPLQAAEEKALNVYNWADYIGPDAIANFEHPAICPSDEERQRAVIGYIFSPKEERRGTRTWSRIKTGL